MCICIYVYTYMYVCVFTIDLNIIVVEARFLAMQSQKVCKGFEGKMEDMVMGGMRCKLRNHTQRNTTLPASPHNSFLYLP